ncbi:SoxR reducing system RseC family protein [Sedimenticola hydrogenitrophicus]|uniref:SoxR reducing system RseC family protein n=1 Tax=Sedimenticola hydrogenitrophicus TaxID=2967975 RepID=UPI0021A29B94|nr:SoxR reducing system RseC family protein [Sedimenticola hydrogenitrophicus]
MIEQTGIVVATTDTTLWVETRQVSGCSACASGSCSSAVVSKLFGERRQRIQLPNTLAASTGDTVVIGIPEAVLVSASLWAYLLPLLVMIGAALTGRLLDAGEGVQGLMGLGGLVAGLMLVRRLTGGGSGGGAGDAHLNPRLLRLSVPASGRAVSFPVGMNGITVDTTHGES